MKYILHLATKKNAPFLQVCWWQIYPWSTSFFFILFKCQCFLETLKIVPPVQLITFLHSSLKPQMEHPSRTKFWKKNKKEEPANCYIHRKSLHFLKKQSLKVDGETYLHLTVKFFYWIHGFRLQAEDTEKWNGELMRKGEMRSS